MKVWVCLSARRLDGCIGPKTGPMREAHKGCGWMRLVPASADALLVEKVDGEWPEEVAARVGVTNVDHRSNGWWRDIVRDGRKRLDGLDRLLNPQASQVGESG